MKPTDTCGYVIRYGSFLNVSPCYRSGNSHGQYQSCFINSAQFDGSSGARTQVHGLKFLSLTGDGTRGVNTSRAEHATQ